MSSIIIEGLNLSPLGTVPRGKLRQYECKDGWIVRRSVSPAQGGAHDGKYVVLGYRPTGRDHAAGRRSSGRSPTTVDSSSVRMPRRAPRRCGGATRGSEGRWRRERRRRRGTPARRGKWGVRFPPTLEDGGTPE